MPVRRKPAAGKPEPAARRTRSGRHQQASESEPSEASSSSSDDDGAGDFQGQEQEAVTSAPAPAPGLTRLQAMRERFSAIARDRASYFARGGEPEAAATSSRRRRGKAADDSEAAAAPAAADGSPATRAQAPADDGAAESDSGSSSSSEGPADDDEQAWPGPYAMAFRMIKARASARRKRLRRARKGEAAGDDEAAERRQTDPDALRVPLSPPWAPADRAAATAAQHRTADAAPRGESVAHRKRGAVGLTLSSSELAPVPPGEGAVPSLQSLCVALLARFCDHIEELGPVPEGPRRRLAWALARARTLDGRALALLAAAPATSIWAPDCSAIEDVDLIAALERRPAESLGTSHAADDGDAPAASAALSGFLSAPSLTVVHLGACGRGMTDRAARALGRSLAPTLHRLHLGAPYRLDDDGLAALLGSAGGGCPELTDLSLTAASTVRGGCMARLCALAPALRRLSLDGCLAVGDDALGPTAAGGSAGGEGPRPGKLSRKGASSADVGSSSSAFLPADLVARNAPQEEDDEEEEGSGEEGAKDVASRKRPREGPAATTVPGPLLALAAPGRCLTHLRLARLPRLSDRVLGPALAALSPSLLALELTELALVTDRSLLAFASPSLEHPGAGAAAAQPPSQAPLGRLRSLVLRGLPGITDVGVRALAQDPGTGAARSLALVCLELADCPAVETEGAVVCLLEAAAGGSAVPTSSSSSSSSSSSAGEDGAADGVIRTPLRLAWDEGVRLARVAGLSSESVVRVAGALSVARAVEAAASAPEGPPGLRRLSLGSSGHAAGDATAAAAARLHGGSLEEVDLAMCRDVSDAAAGELLDSSPRLRHLEVWGCTQIGSEGRDDPLSLHARALAKGVLDGAAPGELAQAAAAIGAPAAAAAASAAHPALFWPRVVGRPGSRAPRPVEGRGESAGAPDWSWADS